VATNILVNTGQGRRVAQAALELCGSPERRDLGTFISIISLNAELVACRTSTPWKSRQHKRRFGSTYRSGRSPHWLKVKNPNAPAVKREAEEDWAVNRRGSVDPLLE
jgi:hypothetical protein